ncbi:hypothetical protein ACPV5L_06715 [Vibrio astriarenae]
MKKITLLATSVALALTGCNSSSSDNNPPPAVSDFTITAIDGYLENAYVFASNEVTCDTFVGMTDAAGQAVVRGEYKDGKVCVQARPYETIDSNRGVVTKRFDLDAPANSSVLNPMTTMVSDLMASDELDETQARAAVIAAITNNSGLEVSESLIFGDYIADESEQAQALNVIGEVLADHSELSTERKTELVELVAQEAQEVIEDDSRGLDNFTPVIDIPSSPSDPIVVEPNSRPEVVKSLDSVELELGDVFTDIDVSSHFKDADGDALTFEIRNTNNNYSPLSIDWFSGIINGEFHFAGNYTFHIFAIDEHGARSYPLVLNVEVTSPIELPEVNEDIQKLIQDEISNWDIYAGQSLDKTLDLSELFTSEADELWIGAFSSLQQDAGLNPTSFRTYVSAEQIVSFEGRVPRTANAGDEQLYVFAGDNINEDSTRVIFDMPKIQEEIVTPPPGGDHPLENHTWYRLEWGSSDDEGNDLNMSRIWCDSIRLEGGKAYFNRRTLDNLKQCSEATEISEESSYFVNGDIIEAHLSWEDDEDGPMTEVIELSINKELDDIAPGAVEIRESFDNGEESLLATWFATPTEAERRLNFKSDYSPENRAFDMYVPAEQDMTYDLGRVSMNMGPEDGNHALFDANVFFDVEGKDFTCDVIHEFYEAFIFTGVSNHGHNLYIHSGAWNDIHCFDNVEEGINFVGINFDIDHELKVGETYSVIGHVKEEQEAYMQEVMFSIEWTGESNAD